MKKSVRILLFKVPVYARPNEGAAANFSKKNPINYTPSLALASLAGFVKKYFTLDHTLEVYDMNVDSLAPFKSEVELSERALNNGQNKIAESDFDVLAISCQFMFNQSYVDTIVEFAHKHNPQAAIIVGGGYATIFPEQAAKQPHIDYAVIGEGEHTLVHILNEKFGISDEAFKEKWPFDGFIRNRPDGTIEHLKKVAMLQNLEDLPLPAWDLFGLSDYNSKTYDGGLPFMSSRGCPMNCSFCSTHLAWGRKVRYRPIQEIVNELLSSYKLYGVRSFSCVDDNVNFDKKWIIEFCNLAGDQLPSDVQITFSNFDLRFIDRDVVRALKKIRVSNIVIATESGSQEIQRKISKKLKLATISETIKMIQEEGLTVHNMFMIGYPDETMDQIMQTVDFARSLRTETMQIWPVFPFPGTRLYDEAKSFGSFAIDERDYDNLHYRSGQISSNEWDAKTVEQIAYDTSIELNFLATPNYDSTSGQSKLKTKMDSIIGSYPGHVIALIVRGHFAKVDEDTKLQASCYNQAVKTLNSSDRTFGRYMSWNYPSILDFLSWVSENHPQPFEWLPEQAEEFHPAGFASKKSLDARAS